MQIQIRTIYFIFTLAWGLHLVGCGSVPPVSTPGGKEPSPSIALANNKTECHKGDLVITTQEELTQAASIRCVEGNLEIMEAPFTDINELKNLSAVGGDLVVGANPNLTNLDGLSGLSSVERSVGIAANEKLVSLSGLRNIVQVNGELSIIYNPVLPNLNGLNNVTRVGHDLKIGMNATLKTVDGLNGLDSVGGTLFIDANDELEHINSLSKLTEIGESLSVRMNPRLISIVGLANIAVIEGDLQVGKNYSLRADGDECSVLKKLVTLARNADVSDRSLDECFPDIEK